MQFLQDPPADGPANMRRDWELLEGLQEDLILRIYAWSGSWASYGYFQSEAEAAAHFAEETLQFVKRPTGGGLVDHRQDLTYTLLIPKSHPWAKLSRAECYLAIHRLIATALTAGGVTCALIEHESGAGAACFAHPVPGDIIDPETGHKLAGAAQRRTRHGLLHQGSILVPELDATWIKQVFLETLD